MKVTTIIRVFLHTLTLLTTLAATGVVLASVLMPYWRTARIDTFMETRMYGLWKICRKSDASKMMTCERREVETDEKPDSSIAAYKHMRREYMTSWETRTLILLSFSIVFGIFALAFGGVGVFVDYFKHRPIFKCMCFAWIVCTLLACILSLAGFTFYFSRSFETENRYVSEYTDRFELIYASSFYNCVKGIVLYGIALLLCLISTVFICVMSHMEKKKCVEVPQKSYAVFTLPGKN